MSKLPPYLCVATVVLMGGCIRPGHMSDSCKVSPSRAVWTATQRAGSIEGQVLDLDGGSPIGNLELRLADLDRRQRTDGQGGFRFDAVPEGRHVLVTEGSVYQTRGDTLTLLPQGGMKGEIDLTTRRSVLASCPLYRRD
jgi:hypothetical protein